MHLFSEKALIGEHRQLGSALTCSHSREARRRGTCTAALVLVGVYADRWRQVLKGLESKHRPLLSKVADATAGGAYLRSVISGPRDSFPPRLLPWILAGPPL